MISEVIFDLNEQQKELEKISSNSKIQVLTNALIVGFSGFKGNFSTEILVGPEMVQRKIEHGVVILATGANEYQPKSEEYSYGQDERVMTQLELAERMESGEIGKPQNVVMIQCIGSRNDENPNCSSDLG